MKYFALALSVALALGEGTLAKSVVPVDTKVFQDMGTINVDGYGPIHIVTRGTSHVRVRM